MENGETKSGRQSTYWLWVGVIAFAVMLAVWGVSLFNHGNMLIFGTRQIERGTLIAAAILGVGANFRWAILRERAESPDE